MAQAVLTGLDTWMSKKWREKQRRWRQQRADWRAEDIQFRFEEILLREEEQDFFQAQLRWREEDMKQRKVGNSRYLWNRFSERNRRDVEEKSEQLRSISWLSGLVTSFTMTSPIEFAFASQSISIAKLTSYAIFAAIVPTLMITSTIICVYLLGRILKMGKMFVAEHVEDLFMKQCCLFAESNGTLQIPPKPRRTFERFWDIRVYHCNTETNMAGSAKVDLAPSKTTLHTGVRMIGRKPFLFSFGVSVLFWHCSVQWASSSSLLQMELQSFFQPSLVSCSSSGIECPSGGHTVTGTVHIFLWSASIFTLLAELVE